MNRDDVFDAILESEAEPELPGQAMGRTLLFVNAKASLRSSVDDIYRLSQAAEKPAELVVDAARAGADELAAALRALDGKPYRGFALLYAAQKADTLVAEDPNKALAVLDASLRRGRDAIRRREFPERVSTPAPRQAVQAEAALLEVPGAPSKGRREPPREKPSTPLGVSSANQAISASVPHSATTTRDSRELSAGLPGRARDSWSDPSRSSRSSGRIICAGGPKPRSEPSPSTRARFELPSITSSRPPARLDPESDSQFHRPGSQQPRDVPHAARAIRRGARDLREGP